MKKPFFIKNIPPKIPREIKERDKTKCLSRAKLPTM
jgi:hypothetical protein